MAEAQGEFLQVITADPMSCGVAGHLVATWTADLGDGQFHYDWLFGDFANAEAALRKGIELMTQPWATSDSRHGLVNAHLNFARLYAAMGRDAGADIQLGEAQAVRQRVTAERPWETEDARQVYWLWDEYQRRRVDFERLNWSAIRTSAERVMAALDRIKLPKDHPRLQGHPATARRDLVRAALEAGDYAMAQRVLEAWGVAWVPLPPTADIQQRFDQLRELLTRIHVLGRNGQTEFARGELARIWPEVDAVFAAGPEYLFNQVQTARALSIRAEIDGDAVAKRGWQERAAGYLRPAVAAGRLTRYERAVLLAAIEKQLAAVAGTGQRP